MNAQPVVRDAVVVGSGLAGLAAALRLARGGASVTLVTMGNGGLQLGQGTIDVLGYAPERVARPFEALEASAALGADHPYRILGVDAVRTGVDFVAQEAVRPGAASASDPLLVGEPDANLHLPTAVGSVRPTYLVQPSMRAGAISGGERFVVVGLRRLKDFQASLVAANLARAEFAGGPVAARHVWIDVEARPGEHDVGGVTYARRLDEPKFRATFATAVAAVVADGETVLLPAVLGMDAPEAFADLAAKIGHPVAEVPLPPPGVPGLRLFRVLSARARAAGVRFVNGSKVLGSVAEGGRLAGLVVGETGRDVTLRARAFVYAPGGFESGALAVDSHGVISEPALGLPLTRDSADGLIGPDFWASDQALFRVGVRVDADLRVLGAGGEPVHPNLHAAGGILAGAARWHEKSGDGIAAASGVRAADAILEEAR